MSDDLVTLNAARRWWLDRIPYLSRVPTDAEVLEAYAEREAMDLDGAIEQAAGLLASAESPLGRS